jgi:integrase
MNADYTVEHWSEYWMETHSRSSVRATTFAAQRYLLKNHIIPGLGNVRLTDLTPAKVCRFLERCRASGSHRPNSAGYPGLSDVTVRHIFRLLHQCLAQAVRDGLIAENPASGLACDSKKPAQTQNILTADEMKAYLAAADSLNMPPMFALELATGLRQSELLTLLWSDLDADNGTLTVVKHRSVDSKTLADNTGAGRKSRTISLTENIVNLLNTERAKHPSSPWMFIHPGSLKPYSPNMVRLLHEKILRKAGLPHIRFLDLRHTFAAHALRNGMGVRILSDILGHSRTSTTRKNYAAYLSEKERTVTLREKQAAADAVGETIKFGTVISAQ